MATTMLFDAIYRADKLAVGHLEVLSFGGCGEDDFGVPVVRLECEAGEDWFFANQEIDLVNGEALVQVASVEQTQGIHLEYEEVTVRFRVVRPMEAADLLPRRLAAAATYLESKYLAPEVVALLREAAATLQGENP